MPKSMRTNAKTWINRALAPFNLEVRKRRKKASPPVAVANPMEAISRINSGERAAIECDISQCVIFNGLGFGPAAWHPFVAALDERDSRQGHSYDGSILQRYYEAWQPANGLECLIGAPGGPQVLASYPAHLMHSPWIDISPDERLRFTARIAAKENRIFGRGDLEIEHGYGLQGPVSPAKGGLEYNRLVEVKESIRSDGYDRTRGDVTAQVLKRGKNFRYRIMHGQHRVAALAHLGHAKIAVLPTMLVIVEEVDHWPQVHRGVWSREEALAYFNHHFDFDSRAWARGLGLAPPA